VLVHSAVQCWYPINKWKSAMKHHNIIRYIHTHFYAVNRVYINDIQQYTQL